MPVSEGFYMAYSPANRHVEALGDVEPFHEYGTAEVFGSCRSIHDHTGFVVSFLSWFSLPSPVGT